MPQDEDNGRPSRGGKVISLRSHQAAEAALDELAQAQREGRDYQGLLRAASTLGPPILAAVIRRLDTSQPQLLTLFRHVVEGYPIRLQAEKVLLRAASDIRSSDGRRLGALLLLYGLGLQAPSAPDFLSSLHSPSASLAHALASILGELDASPAAMDDYASYVMALLSFPVDFLYSALNALSALEEEGASAALRVLALYPHPDLTAGAVEVLCARPSEARMRALAVLEPNLPHESALIVSRTLYKARLSGTHDIDRLLAPDGRCEALLSAIDAQGRRLMWLKIPVVARDQEMINVVGLILDDSSGLLDVLESRHAAFPDAPTGGELSAPIIYEGSDIDSSLDAVSCLEVPFGYGLRVLRDAVRLNWETGTPLPVRYLLSFHLVWQYGGAESEYNHGQEPLAPMADDPYFEAQIDLLSNAEIGGWYLQTAGTRLLAEEIVRASPGPYRPGEESWRMLLPSLIRLAREEFDQGRRALYARRLRLMSEWMGFAGREREAGLCASAARTMLESPPEANLIVLQLIQKGVLVDLDGMGFLDARGPQPHSR